MTTALLAHLTNFPHLHPAEVALFIALAAVAATGYLVARRARK